MLLVNMKKLAEEEGVDWDKEQFEQSEALMLVQLKALLARDLYDQSAYFLIINDVNDIFQAGLRILSSEMEYDNLLRSSYTK